MTYGCVVYSECILQSFFKWQWRCGFRSFKLGTISQPDISFAVRISHVFQCKASLCCFDDSRSCCHFPIWLLFFLLLCISKTLIQALFCLQSPSVCLPFSSALSQLSQCHKVLLGLFFWRKVSPPHYLNILCTSPCLAACLGCAWVVFCSKACLFVPKNLCHATVKGNRRRNVEGRWRWNMEGSKWWRGNVQTANLHRAKIQINTCQALVIPKHPRFGKFWDCYYQLVFCQCCLAAPPRGQMERRLLISQPRCILREGSRRCRNERGVIWALALFPCKAFTISAPGNWSCWHIPVFLPPSTVVLPAYLSCLHLCNFLLTVQQSSSTSCLSFIFKSSLKIHQYHRNRIYLQTDTS